MTGLDKPTSGHNSTASKQQLSAWGLPQPTLEAFREKGLKQLYPWQAAALDCAAAGNNLVYCAPTSGEVLGLSNTLLLTRDAIIPVYRQQKHVLQPESCESCCSTVVVCLQLRWNSTGPAGNRYAHCPHTCTRPPTAAAPTPMFCRWQEPRGRCAAAVATAQGPASTAGKGRAPEGTFTSAAAHHQGPHRPALPQHR
jgi:hypothetical protein